MLIGYNQFLIYFYALWSYPQPFLFAQINKTANFLVNFSTVRLRFIIIHNDNYIVVVTICQSASENNIKKFLCLNIHVFLTDYPDYLEWTFEFNRLPKDFFLTLLLNCMVFFAFCSSNYFIFIYSLYFLYEILKIRFKLLSSFGTLGNIDYFLISSGNQFTGILHLPAHIYKPGTFGSLGKSECSHQASKTFIDRHVF